MTPPAPAYFPLFGYLTPWMGGQPLFPSLPINPRPQQGQEMPPTDAQSSPPLPSSSPLPVPGDPDEMVKDYLDFLIKRYPRQGEAFSAAAAMMHAEAIDVDDLRKWLKEPQKFPKLGEISEGIKKRIGSHFKEFLGERLNSISGANVPLGFATVRPGQIGVTGRIIGASGASAPATASLPVSPYNPPPSAQRDQGEHHANESKNAEDERDHPDIAPNRDPWTHIDDENWENRLPLLDFVEICWKNHHRRSRQSSGGGRATAGMVGDGEGATARRI